MRYAKSGLVWWTGKHRVALEGLSFSFFSFDMFFSDFFYSFAFLSVDYFSFNDSLSLRLRRTAWISPVLFRA